ncbi:MAG: GNAT family N-acetyltransferase [Candidatus Pseudobacter hemicellulosilyticus]|uniref:GNAT family N-acetyltransferase n=1 Tax=Candidatus Pseudobacter hemicellulosilyticus TaxID=3121375 RepID=A0AAJ6BF15_9BACT|nr:MAG: GNAT family N-acetyltransferase [Pseudobacter sp.]
MQVQHKTIGGKGAFYVEQDGQVLAEMVYTKPADNKMIIEHTEVDPSLSGKGVGKLMVQASVEYAREHQMSIIPLCPFAKATFDKVKEWQDVLA